MGRAHSPVSGTRAGRSGRQPPRHSGPGTQRAPRKRPAVGTRYARVCARCATNAFRHAFFSGTGSGPKSVLLSYGSGAWWLSNAGSSAGRDKIRSGSSAGRDKIRSESSAGRDKIRTGSFRAGCSAMSKYDRRWHKSPLSNGPGQEAVACTRSLRQAQPVARASWRAHPWR